MSDHRDQRKKRFYTPDQPINLTTDEDEIELQDYRTPWQRDRDRILHSSSLKRLAGVTQVVDPAEGQMFHNRLTHTLKVAQIARRIAEKFYNHPKSSEVAARFGINPDVVEAAALAHDLGHPPFGHIAEQTLNQLTQRMGLPDGFEGNAQTFRILNQLELRKNGVVGLDLTQATLNAVMKYPWHRGKSGELTDFKNDKHEKWGVYLTESVEFNWVRTGWPEDVRSVEAEIMDYADDIAYSLHDLADFSRAGLIPIARLVNMREERRAFVHSILKNEIDHVEQSLMDFLVVVPMRDPNRSSGSDHATFHAWQSLFITRYVNSIALNPAALNDPKERTVSIPETIKQEIRILKALTRKYVINSPSLVTQQYGKRQVIAKLFKILMRELKARRKGRGLDETILPEDYRTQHEKIAETLKSHGIDDQQAVDARLAADIISSLTDTEALALHKRLTGINQGSVLDFVLYSSLHLH
ncbi:MAG: dNTP triphosphohydrolase [Anaerolineae bacterium]|nr:dNTP triphosphohydrolase [Anaerolineae bacterium]